MKTIRIQLDHETSEVLSDLGGDCFAITGKASYPDDPSRWVLHLVPCTIKAGNNAVAGAQGTARTVRSRKPGKSE